VRRVTGAECHTERFFSGFEILVDFYRENIQISIYMLVRWLGQFGHASRRPKQGLTTRERVLE